MNFPLQFRLVCCFLSALLSAVPPTIAQTQTEFACQQNSDCLNDGECILMQGSNDHYCQCQTGFGGVDCGSECERDCRNGGSCRFHDSSVDPNDPDKNTYCECPPHQFEGETCEISLATVHCPGRVEVRCYNGGTCRREKYGYECDCPIERTGEFCEWAKTEAPTIEAADSIRPKEINVLNSNNSVSNSNETNEAKTAAMLLAGVLLGAGLITFIAMYFFGPKPTKPKNDNPIEEVPISGGEAAMW